MEATIIMLTSKTRRQREVINRLRRSPPPPRDNVYSWRGSPPPGGTWRRGYGGYNRSRRPSGSSESSHSLSSGQPRGQQWKGPWDENEPFFNGASWNELPTYYSFFYGPISSDTYEGCPLNEIKKRGLDRQTNTQRKRE